MLRKSRPATANCFMSCADILVQGDYSPSYIACVFVWCTYTALLLQWGFVQTHPDPQVGISVTCFPFLKPDPCNPIPARAVYLLVPFFYLHPRRDGKLCILRAFWDYYVEIILPALGFEPAKRNPLVDSAEFRSHSSTLGPPCTYSGFIFITLIWVLIGFHLRDI